MRQFKINLDVTLIGQAKFYIIEIVNILEFRLYIYVI